jgi:hypothetical protein
MITILVDHDIEGQAATLWRLIHAAGWPAIFPIKFVLFAEVGLPYESNDRQVWRFAQENGMVLLTANRRMKEADALERTIREENTANSLPVITIGNAKRMVNKGYQERCLNRLLEVLFDLNNFVGVGRVFIP